MSLSAFGDKTRQPTDDELSRTVGRAYGAWRRLIALVEERIESVTEVWGYSGAASGWGLRVRHRERVLLYMTPKQDGFLVSFALGEKAVAAARAARLPKLVLETIDAAPRYAEGRGVRFDVRTLRQAASLADLAEIKHRS